MPQRRSSQRQQQHAHSAAAAALEGSEWRTCDDEWSAALASLIEQLSAMAGAAAELDAGEELPPQSSAGGWQQQPRASAAAAAAPPLSPAEAVAALQKMALEGGARGARLQAQLALVTAVHNSVGRAGAPVLAARIAAHLGKQVCYHSRSLRTRCGRHLSGYYHRHSSMFAASGGL